MRIKGIYTVLLLLIISIASHAQNKDFRLWLSAGIEKKVTKKFSAVYKVSSRLHNNSSDLDNLFGDIGIKYKLFKRFKVNVHYRYSLKDNNKNSFDRRNRVYAGFSYKFKTGTPFAITFSPAYQRQYTNYNSSENGKNPSNTLRSELAIAYSYKKYEPYISSELFYSWDYAHSAFNRIRYKLGVEYAINKKNQIEVYSMLQNGYGNKSSSHDFVVSISYKYIF